MSVENDLFNTNMAQHVHALIKQYEILRDDDKRLWLAFCVKHKDLKKILGPEKYEQFKYWLLNSDVPTFESVSRARRKIQEHFEDTRGAKYRRKKESAEIIGHSISSVLNRLDKD